MSGLPQRLTSEIAPWLFDDAAQAVFSTLAAGGFEGRAVGGAVRNTLLAEPVVDVDIATTAKPEDVVRLARAAGLKAVPTGVAHGTVTVISGKRPFEVTTLRRDIETFGRHATVAFTDDWTEDAQRRDFTMNALYCAADGTLHDPVGGTQDLAQRRVRFIGDADARIREDYLRILRFFRFMAQYGDGRPDGDGLTACIRGRHGLGQLSGERVRQETVKLVVARGAVASIRQMLDCGLVSELYGLAARPTVFRRVVAIEASAGFAPSAMRRLAALLVATPEDAQRLSDRLKVSNAERETLLAASEPSSVPASQHDVAVLLYRRGRERALDLATLALARDLPVACDDTTMLTLIAAAQTMTIPSLPVTGADIVAAGVPPGPRVGELLRALEQAWIDDGFVSGRRALIERIAQPTSGGY